jgi:hypothetical protein
MRLFNAIVLDVWKARRAGLCDLREKVQLRLQETAQRLEALERAFIFEKRIDQATYEQLRDKLREESTLLEIEMHEARIDEFDVEGVLAFAQEVVTDALRLWLEAVSEQRTRLQRVFFPEGISFDGKGFGTAVTCLAFTSNSMKPARRNQMWRPQRDSNPCFGLERATSWASGRWGR